MLLLGCVVGGGSWDWSFDNPEGVSAFVANGEISVTSTEDNTAVVEWEGGGFGKSARPEVGQNDNVVVIDADGGVAGGGELSIEAPAGIFLDLTVDNGSIKVDIDAPASIMSCVGAGDTQIRVPAGAYDLELAVAAGATVTEGIVDDPSSPFVIQVCVGAGSILIEGVREAE
jgi:hypothetical protein